VAGGHRGLLDPSQGTHRSRPHRSGERALSSLAVRVAGRLAQCLAVVVAASTIAFVLLHLAPGDPFTSLGEGMTAESSAQLRHKWGLDQPLWQQYLKWLWNAARGDFGSSSYYERPVWEIIVSRLPGTLMLMGLALFSSILFGILLGAWQGARAGTRRDRFFSTLSLTVYSAPEFWLGLALLLLFSQHWQLLPAGGMQSDTYRHLPTTGARFLDRVEHLVLPWLTLTLVGTAVFARFQRAAMRDSMREPFVRTARAKGLRETKVRGHALRASLLPVITLGGLLFPALLGGAVIVERVFSWPGLGSLLVQAIESRDYLLVTGAVVVASVMTALGTLLADLARAAADPRVAHS
jgi:peptide/nickel transport system permease protein